MISVAIATLGRPAKLERVLQAFSALAPETPPFEVVVVIDGDDPDSRALMQREQPFPLRSFSQPHAGAGPARNRAAREACGDLLLFLNDDTWPEAGCLPGHRHAQQQHGPCMVSGMVAWDPESEITPYMNWLSPDGHQYNYRRLSPGSPVPWDAVWATNLAVPRAWVLDEPFDPNFPKGCLEDSEWALRQYRRGRHAVFVPEALAFHDHHYAGPADYRGRARTFGAAARYFVLKHPSLAWRFTLRPLAATVARLATLAIPSPRRRPRLWDLDFRRNYLTGLLFGPPPAAR